MKTQHAQLAKIKRVISAFKDPTIIAGDFNSTAELPVHTQLRDCMQDTWLEAGNGLGATRYWADLLPFRIDYIYCSEVFEVSETKTLPRLFSDHNPLFSNVFISK